MKYLNGFRTVSARDKHYEYCNSNGQVKVKMPSEKEKCLNFMMVKISSGFHLCHTQTLKAS